MLQQQRLHLLWYIGLATGGVHVARKQPYGSSHWPLPQNKPASWLMDQLHHACEVHAPAPTHQTSKKYTVHMFRSLW
jgi:hypothetical protein